MLFNNFIKHNKNGTRRLCDHRCYRSPNKKCKCICGGINHGAGLQKAIEQTIEHVKYFNAIGLSVEAEDRLLFDVDPMREKKN